MRDGCTGRGARNENLPAGRASASFRSAVGGVAAGPARGRDRPLHATTTTLPAADDLNASAVRRLLDICQVAGSA